MPNDQLVASPTPIGVVDNLPKLDEYQEAAPLVTTAPKKGFGCGRYVIIFFVGLIVLLVLVAALFSDLPSMLQIASEPRGDVASKPVSTPVPDPGNPQNRLTAISYAAIAVDGTIRVYDDKNKELVVNLSDKNWSQLHVSPDGKYVSVLSASSKASNDKNLQLYDIANATWKQVTVFDNSTTGVTGYQWISASTIVFTQESWLHQLNLANNQTTKLSQINLRLVDIDRISKQLLLQGALDQPLSNGTIKKDNVFSAADYTGKILTSFNITQFPVTTTDHLLRRIYFTGRSNRYVAEIVEFTAAAANLSAKKLFLLNAGGRLELPIPEEYSLLGIGSFSDSNVLMGAYEADRALLVIASTDYASVTGIKLTAFASPLPARQKVESAEIYPGYTSESWLMMLQTKENIRGQDTVTRNWFRIDPVTKVLNAVSIGTNYQELVNWVKSSNVVSSPIVSRPRN